MSTHPEVLWAQRSSQVVAEKNIVFLTVNLPDIVESSLKYTLTSTNLSFEATTSANINYAFAFDLFAEVDPNLSTKRLTSRSLNVVLRKKELKSEYWLRLTKEKLKTPFIKTDFSKWVDEDEQDGNPDQGDEDFVGGIPGMDDGMGGGFGGSMGGGFGGGMDLQKMMADIDKRGEKEEEQEDDSEDDGPPPLEDPEPAK